MAITTTKLSFSILDLNSCKLLGILDTSSYSGAITGNTLQIIRPDIDGNVELSYEQGGVTVLNSNNLGYTKVTDPDYYAELPDGLYTAKITVCPYDTLFFERTWYRTCKLECKYYQAFLKLDLNACESCHSKEKAETLNKAWLYIQGIHANTEDCNFDKATELYKVANKLIDEVENCNC